jgi:hypothetical protein
MMTRGMGREGEIGVSLNGLRFIFMAGFGTSAIEYWSFISRWFIYLVS